MTLPSPINWPPAQAGKASSTARRRSVSWPQKKPHFFPSTAPHRTTPHYDVQYLQSSLHALCRAAVSSPHASPAPSNPLARPLAPKSRLLPTPAGSSWSCIFSDQPVLTCGCHASIAPCRVEAGPCRLLAGPDATVYSAIPPSPYYPPGNHCGCSALVSLNLRNSPTLQYQSPHIISSSLVPATSGLTSARPDIVHSHLHHRYAHPLHHSFKSDLSH